MVLQPVWVCVFFISHRCLTVVPVVAPSDVGGGGGSSRELTITWTVKFGLSTGEGRERENDERVTKFEWKIEECLHC